MRTDTLISGRVISCGCYLREILGQHCKIHGKTNTHIYHVWGNMKQRCLNSKHSSFNGYGGRGISICESWMNFENFYKDMGDPPTKEHEIDRINNDGNYELSNCRWSTRKEQMNNMRRNKYLLFEGKNLTYAQWAELKGFTHNLIWCRINKYGWSIEKTLTTPLDRRYSHVQK